MSEETERALSTHRRRRGVAKASITRLTTRLKDLEADVSQPATIDHAQRMQQKLDALDAEFHGHHHNVVDLTDSEDSLTREQDVLDEHDDLVAGLSVRIKQLLDACTLSDATPRKVATRRLAHVRKALSDVSSAIGALSGDPDDTFRLRQYEEQLIDLKKELSETRSGLLTLELGESVDLTVQLATLEKEVFDSSVGIKKKLSSSSPLSTGSSPVTSVSKGVKLPKLDVPTFDGNILNWRSFWEQFHVSVHDRSTLSDSERLVYLQHSLKDGSAKSVIEGLSRSGDNYSEAIECLQACFDRPRLIHQTHVRMISEAPALKDGTGKELRRLHDTAQQHLRALKAMGHEPPGPFITSLLELKLDTNTMFEWQRHSQESADVPHFSKLLEFLNLRAQLLEFLNLRAQASETSVSHHKSSPRSGNPSDRRGHHPSKSVTAFASNTDPSPNCILCGTNKHPLYACATFKSLPHEKMLSTLKDNNLCLNCLKPGHFVRECKSLYRCRKCQKPHHSLLHVEQRDPPSTQPSTQPSSPPVSSVTSNLATGLASNTLLMTCWVLIHSPSGSVMKVRALLDSASSTSFISERLTHLLEFPHTRQNVRISGVADLSHGVPSHSIVQLAISPLQSPADKSQFRQLSFSV